MVKYSDKQIVDKIEEFIEDARVWGGDQTNKRMVKRIGELIKKRKPKN